MPRRHSSPKHTPFQPISGCSGKKRFNRREQAERAKDDAELTSIHLQLAVYRCDHCSGWHLTSKIPG